MGQPISKKYFVEKLFLIANIFLLKLLKKNSWKKFTFKIISSEKWFVFIKFFENLLDHNKFFLFYFSLPPSRSFFSQRQIFFIVKIREINWNLESQKKEKNMSVLGVEPRLSRPQREVLTTRRHRHLISFSSKGFLIVHFHELRS